MSGKSSKRDRILKASQTNSATALTKTQLVEASKRPVHRTMNTDPLSHQQSIVQNRIKELKEDLPHLYGWPFYKWAREFFESRNKINLLVAGNQLSKSSSAIRKNIEWACNKKLWPSLWSTEPKIFWYFYPSEGVSAIEFEKKWVPEFLPRGAMKNDTNYGWDVEYNNGTLEALHFRSGVTIYFKSYGQKVVNLQTATVHMITCFTAGHLIITSRGLKKVEDIRVGDQLLGEGGWNTVTQALVQHAPVTKKYFTNGEVLEATDEHPMWTYNRGWVRFSDLTHEDVLATFPLWKLIKRLYCLKVWCTRGCLRTLMSAIGIISEGIAKAATRLFMSNCGVLTTNETCLRGTLSITRTSIRWTILSRIWSYLHGLNTLEFTRLKSGSLKSPPNSYVLDAGRPSNLEVHSSQQTNSVVLVRGKLASLFAQFARLPILQKLRLPSIAPKNVQVWGCVDFVKRMTNEFALAVMKCLSVGRVSLRPTAQETAQTEIKAIHTLTVTGSNTYLSNGFYCHNCDEELPSAYLDELLARLRSTGGYFNQVFTATMGQEIYYRAMECIGTEDEVFKTAFKQRVSMYDCQFYEDGTPSKWTLERIAEAEAQCTSKKEVLKRIHGRFVKDEGLRYEPFDPDRNVKPAEPVPHNWKHYAAVDIGSGGKGRSAGAIVFISVSPDYTKGRVVRSWRGDNEETTASDILNKYRELRGDLAVTNACYDYASREFGLIASRSGEGFIPADKARVAGEATVNTLFKSGALTIDAGVYHNQKLVTELMSVPGGPQKNRAYVDDASDALKYCISLVPWDFATISPNEFSREENRDEIPKLEWTEQEHLAWQIRQRRGEVEPRAGQEGWQEFDDEIDMWNEAYGS